MTDTNWYLTLKKCDTVGYDEDGKERVIEHKITKGFTEREIKRLNDIHPIELMRIPLRDMFDRIQQARGLTEVQSEEDNG